ncbi:autotransporter outer membrane beta-barrel domain-containing protein [Stenotrophomonas maltophilia]|uniref:autotransporter outer membrane beta-barrel domain-containing protein n=1 Tax=Stenotrophomonas maltophilia TaxID=40324 RepID=UPI0039C1200A
MKRPLLRRTATYVAIHLSLAGPAFAADPPVWADNTALSLPAGATIDTGTAGGDAGSAVVAINGGTVTGAGSFSLKTGGALAHAVMVDGDNSKVQLTGGDLLTTGTGYAIYATGNGEADISNALIISNGSALVARGGLITVGASSITANGFGLHAYAGGRIDATDVNIQSAAWGVESNMAGTVVSLRGNNFIRTSNDGAFGLLAQNAGLIDSFGPLRINTDGAGAYGVLARSGGHVELNGARIGTTGNHGEGVRADGGTVNVIDTGVSTGGDYAVGVHALNGGALVVGSSTIETQGQGASAAMVESGGSLTVGGSALRTKGLEGHGVVVGTGSAATVRNSTIDLHGDNSYGVWARGTGATATVWDTQITNSGNQSAASSNGTGGIVASQGGQVDAYNTHVLINGINSNGRSAVSVESDSHITLHGSSIVTDALNAHAATVYGGNSSLTLDGASITTRKLNSRGVAAADGSTALIKGGVISTEGAGSAGLVAVRGGLVTLQNGTQVVTAGVASHAASASGTGSRIAMAGGGLTTHSAQSAGVNVANGASAALDQVIVRAMGAATDDPVNKTHGLRVDGAGTIAVAGGSIAATGHAVHATGGTAADRASVSFDGVNALENDGILAQAKGGVLDFSATASRLAGDLRVDAADVASTTATARMDGATQWQGATQGLQSIALADSRWTMTASSQVGALDAAASTITFDHSDGHFKTLSVDGNYHGDNALLQMSTALGDDASQTDRLIVGGDTSGSTALAVANRGGLGAQTDKGILLVQVDGASNGQFTQQGRVVGGLYEYYLHKGHAGDAADGNWYLRSVLPTVAPDPCAADPAAAGCGVIDPILPVLRPEPAAYLANQALAMGMFQHTLHERMGEPNLTARPDDNRGGNAWVRVKRDQIDQTVAGQFDVDSDLSALQVGVDLAGWGSNSRGMVGVMLGAGTAKTESLAEVSGKRAVGKVRGGALGVYGTWYQHADKAEGLYVDTWLQGGRFRNTVQGEERASERYNSQTVSASAEAGYAFRIADNARRALYIEPQVQVIGSTYRIDGGRHVEGNGTHVASSAGVDLTTRVGARVYGHSLTDQRRVQPFLALNWWRRGDAARRLTFDGQTLDEGIAQGVQQIDVRDIYEVKLGAQLQLSRHLTGWGEMKFQSGAKDYRNISGQIGVKYSW